MSVFRTFQAVASTQALDTCNFDQIEKPGTYVENRWGTLFRMPLEALPKRKHARRNAVTREPWPVTRLTSDPDVPVSTARGLAEKLGVWVSF